MPAHTVRQKKNQKGGGKCAVSQGGCDPQDNQPEELPQSVKEDQVPGCDQPRHQVAPVTFGRCEERSRFQQGST